MNPALAVSVAVLVFVMFLVVAAGFSENRSDPDRRFVARHRVTANGRAWTDDLTRAGVARPPVSPRLLGRGETGTFEQDRTGTSSAGSGDVVSHSFAGVGTRRPPLSVPNYGGAERGVLLALNDTVPTWQGRDRI